MENEEEGPVSTNKIALLVIDVQADFCPGGSLAVSGGDEVATKISELIKKNRYDYVVASQDWHIDPNQHFSDEPDFVNTWPKHCVAGTEGAEFHPNLDITHIDRIVRKGQFAAAYSAFEGRAGTMGSYLGDLLREHDITDVDIVGIATDHCVKATALDSVKQGFKTYVLLDCCAAVSPETEISAKQEMSDAGIVFVTNMDGKEDE